MAFSPFTSLERASIGEVLAHQHGFAPPPGVQPTTGEASELHIALDGDGAKEISRQVQPAEGGEMDEAMQAAANSSLGCRIFHNHPSHGSLSASDWNVLANHPGMEMVAVNSRGTTFRGKVVAAEAFPDWFAAVTNAETAVCEQWEAMISTAYNRGDFDLGDYASANRWLVTLAIAEELCARAYVEFEAVPIGEDAAVLSDKRAIALRQDLQQMCAAAIP
jgi:hypothetical protein